MTRKQDAGQRERDAGQRERDAEQGKQDARAHRPLNQADQGGRRGSPGSVPPLIDPRLPDAAPTDSSPFPELPGQRSRTQPRGHWTVSD